MGNIRKKLAKLLTDAWEYAETACAKNHCWDCPVSDAPDPECVTLLAVDYLIDHGVMVVKKPVRCPTCNGRGIEAYYEEVGRTPETVTSKRIERVCSLCKGTGTRTDLEGQHRRRYKHKILVELWRNRPWKYIPAVVRFMRENPYITRENIFITVKTVPFRIWFRNALYLNWQVALKPKPPKGECTHES